MIKAKKVFYENQAKSIIKKLEMRKMEGYYCPDIESAIAKVMELVGDKKQLIGCGDSVTIRTMKLWEMLEEKGHEVVLRKNYTEDTIKEYKAKLATADTFLMSTNAITLDGELINIDGRGNRLAGFIYGPDQVIVVAGMNKVVSGVEDGVRRTRDIAAPQNTVRLNYDTPCKKIGRCANCLENSICCQIVVTRASMEKGRIKVILVGEELGY